MFVQKADRGGLVRHVPGHSLDRLLVVQNAVNRLFEFFGEAEQMVHVPDADALVMNLRGGLLYALALGQEHRPGEGVDECEHCACSLADVELLVPATLVERDLLRDRAGSLTSRPPLTVTPATTVRRVLQLMNENSVGCVGIVKDGRLVGIFSERDALLKLGTDAASLGRLSRLGVHDG